MYELSQARRDDKMSRRRPTPIKQWIIKGGRLKAIEDGPLWPKTPAKRAIKKNANAKRRRRDKEVLDN